MLTFNVKKHLENYLLYKEGKEDDEMEFVTLQMLNDFCGKAQNTKELGRGDLSGERRVYRVKTTVSFPLNMPVLFFFI